MVRMAHPTDSLSLLGHLQVYQMCRPDPFGCSTPYVLFLVYLLRLLGPLRARQLCSPDPFGYSFLYVVHKKRIPTIINIPLKETLISE